MNRRITAWLLGFVAATVLVSLAPGARESRTVRVYVGTYTDGVSRGIYLVDFDASTGKWGADPVLAGASENPSQGSNSLVVFRLDPGTGLPVAVGSSVTVSKPACVLFAPSSPKVHEAPVP